jgi:hypothetical protein
MVIDVRSCADDLAAIGNSKPRISRLALVRSAPSKYHPFDRLLPNRVLWYRRGLFFRQQAMRRGSGRQHRCPRHQITARETGSTFAKVIMRPMLTRRALLSTNLSICSPFAVFGRSHNPNLCDSDNGFMTAMPLSIAQADHRTADCWRK